MSGTASTPDPRIAPPSGRGPDGAAEGGHRLRGSDSIRRMGLIERYIDRLPFAAGDPIISLNEGSTPLIEAPRLSERIGREKVARRTVISSWSALLAWPLRRWPAMCRAAAPRRANGSASPCWRRRCPRLGPVGCSRGCGCGREACSRRSWPMRRSTSRPTWQDDWWRTARVARAVVG